MAAHACSACGKDKPLAQFKKWRNSEPHAAWWCDDCRPARITAGTRKQRATPEGRERDRKASRRWKEQNRERNRTRDRAASRERRDACPECGGLKMPESAICQGCHVAARVARRTRIKALWHEGLTVRAIADDLDSTVSAVGVEIAHMRQDGWDVPHRRTPEQVARIRAGWERARQAA